MKHSRHLTGKSGSRALDRASRLNDGLEFLEPRRLLSGQTFDVQALLEQVRDPSLTHGSGCYCGGCGAVSQVDLPLRWEIPAIVQQNATLIGGKGHMVDSQGNELFFCPAPEPFVNWGPPTVQEGGMPAGAPGGGDGGDGDPRSFSPPTAPAFDSRPGAPRTIYLDFTGHVVTGTNWNNFNNGNPIHALPYDLDGNPGSFNSTELARIEQIWRRTAEDFAPFDVNVTTVEPPLSHFTEGARALRVMISTDVDAASMGGTGNRWFSGAGGVAYLGSWRWTSDTPVWVFYNNLGNGNAKFVAEATSHEIGHAYDLRHDGVIGGSAYYQGHGSGPTGWAPIMGVGYHRPLSQWSRGEYANANNQENDLAIITKSSNKVTYRPDDHGNTFATATWLSGNHNQQGNDHYLLFDASGVIERNTDIDIFRLDLSVSSGRLQMAALPLGYAQGYSNLHARLSVWNESGQLVASHMFQNQIYAQVDLQLPAGVYFAGVQGTGKGDPLGTGYTDYASLGQYDLLAEFSYQPDPVSPDVVITVNGTEKHFTKPMFTPYSTMGQTGDLRFLEDSTVVEFFGSTWRKIEINHLITPSTVLTFDAAQIVPGEIIGIGFDSDNNHSNHNIQGKTVFQIAGSRTWSGGIQDFRGLPGDGSYKSFTIPVGQYFTGFMPYMVFLNHDRDNEAAVTQYRDITVTDLAQNDHVVISVNGQPRQFTESMFTPYSTMGQTGGVAFPSSSTVEFFGSTWRKIEINHLITPNTVLKFDAAQIVPGEIIGIGFDSDNNHSNHNVQGKTVFQVAGDRTWSGGIQDFRGLPGNGSYKSFTIPVGQYFTGYMPYMVFLNHDRDNDAAVTRYSNIAISEDTTFKQWEEKDGLVVIEAEEFQIQQPGQGAYASHAWQVVASPAGFSGTGAIQALPNVGVNTGESLTGPRVDFPILFNTPGIYYAWLRMYGATTADNSVHVGMDGAAASLGNWGVSVSPGAWRWTNSVSGLPDPRVRVEIPSPGLYTLNVWMRKDGVVVDKIVLSNDFGFDPGGGLGPNGVGLISASGDSLQPLMASEPARPALRATPFAADRLIHDPLLRDRLAGPGFDFWAEDEDDRPVQLGRVSSDVLVA